jgi:hypothetical protein
MQVNLSLLRSNSLKFQPQEKKEEVRVMTKKKKKKFRRNGNGKKILLDKKAYEGVFRCNKVITKNKVKT